MALTDTAPALISTKAAVAVAELTLASLKDEMRRYEGLNPGMGQEWNEAKSKADFLASALERLKQAQIWLQLAQPEVES